jgi:hypothetical protein
MGDRPTPETEVIHPEVEVLPPDHSEPNAASTRSPVWLSVDSQGGKFRVHVVKPGPIATLLMALAFGLLMIVSFVVALGLFAIVVGVSTVALGGLLIYGLVRGALKRLR